MLLLLIINILIPYNKIINLTNFYGLRVLILRISASHDSLFSLKCVRRLNTVLDLLHIPSFIISDIK